MSQTPWKMSTRSQIVSNSGPFNESPPTPLLLPAPMSPAAAVSSVCLTFCLSLCLPLCLSVSLYVCPCLPLSVSLFFCPSIRPELVQTIACVDLFENCVRTNVALTQHFPIFMARPRAKLGSAWLSCLLSNTASRQTDGQMDSMTSPSCRTELQLQAQSPSLLLSSYAPKAVQSPAATWTLSKHAPGQLAALPAPLRPPPNSNPLQLPASITLCLVVCHLREKL